MLFECFLAFFGPKNAKKHSKSTLWGTPRQVPKIAQKALRGALSGPGPKSTPVNGGRDRNPTPKSADFTFGIIWVRKKVLTKETWFSLLSLKGRESPGNCSGSSFYPDQALLSKNFRSRPAQRTQLY